MPRLTLTLALSSLAFLASAPAQTTPPTPPGGANARNSQQGCMNEWLFNGIWRLRVTDVQPVKTVLIRGTSPQYGWQVSVEVRNGTRERLSPSQTGFEITNNSANLYLAGGDFLPLYKTSALVTRGFDKLPQGGAMKINLPFYAERDVQSQPPRPEKIVFEIDFSRAFQWQFKSRYTAKEPSFRVFLNCKK